MRISLRLFGLDILDVEVTTDADSPSLESDPRDLSGGTLASTPIGFSARWDRPDEAGLPERG